MASNSAGEMISILFLSREIAHREHLLTGSYATHMALGSFYGDVIELADRLAEAYMGEQKARLTEIPFQANNLRGDIIEVLSQILRKVKILRDAVCPDNSSIQAIIDDIEELFFSTIYKLTFLK